MIRGIELEPETQLDATFEFIHILVRHALGPSVLAVPFTPKPRLVAIRVWGPRVLLVKRRYHHEWRLYNYI
jgi:hypothetical protein